MDVAWPPEVRRAVEDEAGAPVVVERLGGLSGRDVRLARGPRGGAVVKRAPHPRETAFYRRVAGSLEPGLTVPRVLLARDDWLVLEHLPEPLPRDRWLADASVMRALAAVHRSTAARDLVTDPFRPSWTPALTAAAVERLDTHDRAPTFRAVERLSQEADRWLSGDALVSGDPNPRNWGLRADGTLVLFDWERTGFATPALDVAITVPGLPTRDQLEIAATTYLSVQHRDHVHWSHDDFTRGLVVAKAWTFIELLAEQRDGPAVVEVQRRLAAALPAWVAALP